MATFHESGGFATSDQGPQTHMYPNEGCLLKKSAVRDGWGMSAERAARWQAQRQVRREGRELLQPERAEASVSEVELQPRAGAAVSTSCVNVDLLPRSVFDLDLLPPHAQAHKKWFGAQVSFVLVGLRAMVVEEGVAHYQVLL